MHRTFLKRFPLFIWLLFALSRCLVSALTQAGGGDLLLRFASSVQSCCGEGGALQADLAVCGEHSPSSGQAARGLALSPRARRTPSLGSQGVFRQEPGPVCRVGGGGFSGAEFAPCPSPGILPPAGMGRLFSGVSQSLCFANRWRCVPARLIFPLLSHV